MSKAEQGDKERSSMESLEEKLGRLTSCLHYIKAMGRRITVEQRGNLRRLVSQATAELEEVKEFLINSVSDQLSPRQVAVIDGEEDMTGEEEEGIQWDSVFARCFNVGINHTEVRSVNYKKNKTENLATQISHTVFK